MTIAVDLGRKATKQTEENQEAYKNWQYFKKNQSDLTEQWKTYWAKKLIESYEEKETEENEKSPETE